MSNAEGREVLVVGAGISGSACARRLYEAGVPVSVVDRGDQPGGRLGGRLLAGRLVDAGAAYFTAAEPRFQEQVDRWVEAGSVRSWTRTFDVIDDDGRSPGKEGPQRYAGTGGLRGLAGDLLAGVPSRSPVDVDEVCPGLEVEGRRYAAVVLAMPDPQALDLLGDGYAVDRALVEDREWSPTLTLLSGWPRQVWEPFDALFVNGDPVLRLLVDDGRRRGDDAPVLVAQSTADFAREHLDAPDEALRPMLETMCSRLEIEAPPYWVQVKRWSLSTPEQPHEDAPYHLGDSGLAFCGDSWVGGLDNPKPRVEAAYLSGLALGDALVARLG